MNKTQRAAQDLADKIALEEKLTLDLVELFERISDEYQKELTDRGVPPAFDIWQSFFEDILKSHYQATRDLFSRRIEQQLNLEVTEDERNLIAGALAIFFASEAIATAEEINKTNDRQAKEAFERAQEQQRLDFTETGEQYTPATLALVATNIFRASVFGRVTTIATTETQKASESSKLVESEVISGERPTINTPGVPGVDSRRGTKDWVATLDDATRDTHVTADRTQRSIDVNKPFSVGGFLMKYPGDKALGAPIEEWINCRCNSIYTPSPSVVRERRK